MNWMIQCRKVSLSMDQCHFEGYRKSLDEGGSKPVYVACYGPAVDLFELMMIFKFEVEYKETKVISFLVPT